MSNIRQELAYRAKAVATACGAIVQTAVLALIVDPATEAQIVKVIPAPYQVVASLILGAIITGVVHRVPNRAKATTESVVQEPPTDTTIVRLSAINGGEFVGPPAH